MTSNGKMSAASAEMTRREKELSVMNLNLRRQIIQLRSTQAQFMLQISEYEQRALDQEIDSQKSWLVPGGFMAGSPSVPVDEESIEAPALLED